MNIFLLIVLLIVLILLYYLYKKNFKEITLNCVNLITGAPKTGKSLLSVALSTKEYKKRHFKWFIKSKIFGVKVEEPLYYTNTAVSFGDLNSKKPHRLDKNIRMIELSHLLREKRFNYGSVVYFCESSLTADCQDVKDAERNAQLSMFNKLFGHETKGGILFYDTQNPADNHYSIKRVVGSYIMIFKKLNFLGLFTILYLREMISKEFGSNECSEDVEFSLRKVLISNRCFKKYDCYYFSYLTDNLSNDSVQPVWYKGGLVSFNPLYRNLSERNGKEKKDD